MPDKPKKKTKPDFTHVVVWDVVNGSVVWLSQTVIKKRSLFKTPRPLFVRHRYGKHPAMESMVAAKHLSKPKKAPSILL